MPLVYRPHCRMRLKFRLDVDAFVEEGNYIEYSFTIKLISFLHPAVVLAESG